MPVTEEEADAVGGLQDLKSRLVQRVLDLAWSCECRRRTQAKIVKRRGVFNERSMVREGGPACEVLAVGEMPDPRPGPGEVRIRIAASGINPGDIKKRQDSGSAWARHIRAEFTVVPLDHVALLPGWVTADQASSPTALSMSVATSGARTGGASVCRGRVVVAV